MTLRNYKKTIVSWVNTPIFGSYLTILDILFVLFIIVCGLVMMRNFELRMSNLHVDDGPILYAHVFKNPHIYAKDYQVGSPILLRTSFKVITSAMVWIPALLWKYLNIDPYFSTWVITFLQIILIGISVYFFSFEITNKRVLAILSVIFAYASNLWTWSPPNYSGNSGFLFEPYPANLAIAPILFSFIYALRDRTPLALFMLIIAGLIHPNLALYACIIIGIYWLWGGYRRKDKGLWKHLLGLFIAGIIIISPALWVQLSFSGEALPLSELMVGMRQNQHITPWGYESRWIPSLRITILWLILAILSFRWVDASKDKFKRFWLAALVGASLLGFSQIIGSIFEIPTLLNIIGLRSFSLLAFISLPLIINYLYMHIYSREGLGGVLSILLLGLPIFIDEYALFWTLVLAFILLDLSQGFIAIWKFSVSKKASGNLKATTMLSLLLFIVIYITSPDFFGWFLSSALPKVSDRGISLAIIISFSILIWILHKYTYKPFSNSPKAHLIPIILNSILILGYASGLLWKVWDGQKNIPDYIDSYLDVQLWAKENTPISSLFVVPDGGWRTMSLRRKLSPFTRESYAYVMPPSQAIEHREHLLEFYGISSSKMGDDIVYLERELFWEFDESDYLRFYSEFGATHLVISTHHHPDKTGLCLPVAYQNQHYRVYELQRADDECNEN